MANRCNPRHGNPFLSARELVIAAVHGIVTEKDTSRHAAPLALPFLVPATVSSRRQQKSRTRKMTVGTTADVLGLRVQHHLSE
ncbi:MAG: hypothetical protein ACWGNK_02850 [Desulfobacterales bacterium]